MFLEKYLKLSQGTVQKISFDTVLLSVLLSMILVILVSAYQTLIHPIGQQQSQQIDQLAVQQVYPQTRMLARDTLGHPQISYGQYLKVIHAYQREQQQAQHLPALQLKDTATLK